MTAPARGTLPHPMTGARDPLPEFLAARFGAGASRPQLYCSLFVLYQIIDLAATMVLRTPTLASKR